MRLKSCFPLLVVDAMQQLHWKCNNQLFIRCALVVCNSHALNLWYGLQLLLKNYASNWVSSLWRFIARDSLLAACRCIIIIILCALRFNFAMLSIYFSKSGLEHEFVVLWRSLDLIFCNFQASSNDEKKYRLNRNGEQIDFGVCFSFIPSSSLNWIA